jgi:hypothetical protein
MISTENAFETCGAGRREGRVVTLSFSDWSEREEMVLQTQRTNSSPAAPSNTPARGANGSWDSLSLTCTTCGRVEVERGCMMRHGAIRDVEWSASDGVTHRGHALDTRVADD